MKMIIAVPEWKVDGSKRGCHGDALPGAVQPKVLLRYPEWFQKRDMKLDFAETV